MFRLSISLGGSLSGLPIHLFFRICFNSQLTLLSTRFCSYPQAIILQLQGGKQRIRKLQILSHHCMISSRIDISVGNSISQVTINSISTSGVPRVATSSSAAARRMSKSSAPANRQTVAGQYDPGFWSQVYFDRIGYISLDDNQRTQYKARELKSVHVDVIGEFVHLQMAGCFSNPLNPHNQIGIVAVYALGDSSGFGGGVSAGNLLPLAADLPVAGGDNKGFVDTSSTNGGYLHDQALLKWISAFARAKALAVDKEDFALAKELKVQFDSLKEVSKSIAALERKKRVAIHNEDFDGAKVHKDESERVKAGILEKLVADGWSLDSSSDSRLVHSKLAGLYSGTHSGINRPAVEVQSRIAEGGADDQLPVSEPVPIAIPHVADDENRPLKPKSQHFNFDEFDESTLPPGTEPNPNRKMTTKKSANELATSQVKSEPAKAKVVEIDDNRPLKPKSAINLDEMDENSLPPGIEPSPSGRKPAAKKAAAKKEKVEPKSGGEESDVPVPKKKAPAKKVVKPKAPAVVVEDIRYFSTPDGPPFDIDDPGSNRPSEWAETAQVFSDAVVDAILSKNFAHKEWALSTVQHKFDEAIKKKDPSKLSHSVQDIVVAGYTIIKTCLADPREKVTTSCLELWNTLLVFQNDYGDVIAQRRIEVLFPNLLLKPVEVNPRVKNMSLDLITLICEGYPIVSNFIFKNPTVAGPKFLKGRLDVASHVLTFSQAAIPCAPIVILKWASSHWSNNSGDIRDAANKVIIALYKRLRREGKSAIDAGTEIFAAAASTKPQIQQALRAAIDDFEQSFESEKATKKSKKATAPDSGKPIAAPPKVDVPPPEESPYIKPITAKSPSKPTTSSQMPRNAASPPPTKPKTSPLVEIPQVDVDNTWNVDKTCIFCDERNDSFDENNLDLHYWNSCLMLMNCPQCNQITEISGLTAHYANDCELSTNVRRCTECHLFFPVDTFDRHAGSKACKPASLEAIRCPLCFKDLGESSETTWKKHFLTDGCQMSPRKHLHSNSLPSTTKSKQNAVTTTTSTSQPSAEGPTSDGDHVEEGKRKKRNPFKWFKK
eukprot:Partr_v1_DN28618_c0_g1_i3_m50394 putative centrosomal protein 104kDa